MPEQSAADAPTSKLEQADVHHRADRQVAAVGAKGQGELGVARRVERHQALAGLRAPEPYGLVVAA